MKQMSSMIYKKFRSERALCSIDSSLKIYDGTLNCSQDNTNHIIPTIEKLKKKIDLSGPLSPDSCFSKFARTKFDGYMCIYHDQALIPVKTLDFLHSVNVTGGLPIIRLSPDHGPAFDIAKLKKANPGSMIATINLLKNIS